MGSTNIPPWPRTFIEGLSRDGFFLKVKDGFPQVLEIPGATATATRLTRSSRNHKLVYEVEYRNHADSRCEICNRPLVKMGMRTYQLWDLPYGDHWVELTITQPRMRCKHCGKDQRRCLPDDLQPNNQHGIRVTARLNQWLKWRWSGGDSLNDLSKRSGVPVSAVSRLSSEWIEEGLSYYPTWDDSTTEITISVDELVLGNRFYLVLLAHLDRGLQLLELQLGREPAQLREALKKLLSRLPANVQVFYQVDTWEDFIETAQEVLGPRFQPILDRFHLIRLGYRDLRLIHSKDRATQKQLKEQLRSAKQILSQYHKLIAAASRTEGAYRLFRLMLEVHRKTYDAFGRDDFARTDYVLMRWWDLLARPQPRGSTAAIEAFHRLVRKVWRSEGGRSSPERILARIRLQGQRKPQLPQKFLLESQDLSESTELKCRHCDHRLVAKGKTVRRTYHLPLGSSVVQHKTTRSKLVCPLGHDEPRPDSVVEPPKISDELREFLERRWAEGTSKAQLARQYNLSTGTVGKVLEAVSSSLDRQRATLLGLGIMALGRQWVGEKRRTRFMALGVDLSSGKLLCFEPVAGMPDLLALRAKYAANPQNPVLIDIPYGGGWWGGDWLEKSRGVRLAEHPIAVDSFTAMRPLARFVKKLGMHYLGSPPFFDKPLTFQQILSWQRERSTPQAHGVQANGARERLNKQLGGIKAEFPVIYLALELADAFHLLKTQRLDRNFEATVKQIVAMITKQINVPSVKPEVNQLLEFLLRDWQSILPKLRETLMSDFRDTNAARIRSLKSRIRRMYPAKGLTDLAEFQRQVQTRFGGQG